MDKRFSVKPGQKFGTSHQYHLGLILLLCLSFCSETVNAHPKPSHLNPPPQLIAQTDTLTQAQQLVDEGLQLAEQSTAESLQQAITKLEAALPLWRELGEKYKSGEALTLRGIGLFNNDLGFKRKALEYYQQALSLWRALGDFAEEEAETLNRIGSVYSDLGEKQQALDYYQQALPLSRKVGDRAEEAGALNRIGSVYSDLGKKQQALDYYQQALSLWRAVGDRSGEAIALNNIGSIYSALGEKQQALDYYQQVLSLRRAVGDRAGVATTLNNSADLATILTNIGSVYDDLGEKQQALDYYQQALDYYQQALPLSPTVGARALEVKILNNIGGVYSDLGKKQQAIQYWQEALSLWRAVGDRAGVATSLNNIGFVYHASGEKQQALDHYQEALSLWRAVGDRKGVATTLNNIGGVYHALGEKQQALDCWKQALLLSRAVGNRAGEVKTLSNIAYLERNRGNLQAALIPLQDSINIREDLRTKVVSPELRQTYFSTLQGAYQFYIDLLMELHQRNPSQGYDKKAFHISESSRARTLLELLTEANANIKEGVDPQLLAQEKSLQGQLDATEKQRLDIYNNPNSKLEQKTDIDQKHKTLLKQYQELQTDLRQKSPNYAALKYPQPLTLEQVQEDILDEDTVLLQYSLGKENSYLWVVTKEEMQSYQLPSQEEIEKRAKNVLRTIKQLTIEQQQKL
ncbi:MAG: tetratricopeptide repeat protein [Xenococcaceae cyanobacterium MO_188.B32]|nr:tetratricopeptide repeat protein [Xenococcaceae cyanobacterium MO_188.B32]